MKYTNISELLANNDRFKELSKNTLLKDLTIPSCYQVNRKTTKCLNYNNNDSCIDDSTLEKLIHLADANTSLNSKKRKTKKNKSNKTQNTSNKTRKLEN